MNLTKREKSIFIITTVVVGAIILFNFAIEPFFKKWQGLNKEILAQEIKIQKGLKLLKNKDLIIKDYRVYASVVKDMSKLLGYVEKGALSAGIKTENIKPRPLIHKEIYEEYVIELQIEGTLESINKFISYLSKSPVFMTVKEFDIRAVTGVQKYFKGTLILSKIII
jgi:hypothetical protein